MNTSMRTGIPIATTTITITQTDTPMINRMGTRTHIPTSTPIPMNLRRGTPLKRRRQPGTLRPVPYHLKKK